VLAQVADDSLTDEVRRVASGSFKVLNPPQIRGSGYVVESLEAALWAFYNADNFADGACMAVNLGDDADTTGAVYGQIAGAFYGASGIPGNWLNTIVKRELIQDFADRIYALRYMP